MVDGVAGDPTRATVSEAVVTVTPLPTAAPSNSSAYSVLGVSPEATEAEIRKAFRAQVLKTHPDKGGSTAAFDAVKLAYEQIRTPELKAAYDESLKAKTIQQQPQSQSSSPLQIELPAQLAIKPALPIAEKTSATPLAPAPVIPKEENPYQPPNIPGKSHDEQIAYLWQQLGMYLGQRYLEKLVTKDNIEKFETWKTEPLNKEFLLDMSKKYGPEKVADLCAEAVKGHLQPDFYKDLQKSIADSLQESVTENPARRINLDSHTEAFIKLGLNEEQAKKAAEFKVGPEGTGGSKHSNEDIANAFKDGNPEHIKSDADVEKANQKSKEEAAKLKKETEERNRAAEDHTHTTTKSPRMKV